MASLARANPTASPVASCEGRGPPSTVPARGTAQLVAHRAAVTEHVLWHRMEKQQILRKEEVDLGVFRAGTKRAVPVHTQPTG